MHIPNPTRHLAAVLLMSCLVFAPVVAAIEAPDALGQLRGVTVPHGASAKSEIDALNKRMDAAWSYFKQHPDQLSVAAHELQKETAAEQPDQFFLLDVSYLLLQEQHRGAEAIALAALDRVDAGKEIIQANLEELLHCLMRLGASGQQPEQYLNLVDRFYLNSSASVTFFRAPHYVDLNAEDLRILTYGVAGEAAANHLASRLAGASVPERLKLLRLLSALGSEQQTPAVSALLNTATDYETVTHCVAVLMRVGGPSGRDAVVALNPTKLDPKAREYVQRIVPEANKVNSKLLSSQLEQVAKGSLSDREAQKRLDRMEERNGQDEDTPPAAIARSGIPKDKLLAQLKRIRARSFRREDNHVFEDLDITNTLINAVQYR